MGKVTLDLRTPGRPVLQLAALLACVLAASAARAEQAAGGEEKHASDEKPFDWDDKGRRDPFTITFRPDLGPIEPPPGLPGTTPVPQENKLDPKLIIQKRAEAEKCYVDAENAFLELNKEGRIVEAVTRCDAGLKVFADTPNAGGISEWQPVRNRLEGLRRAIEHIRQRQDAERKFHDLNIRLVGVVAREKHSLAIVNGKTVKRGDLITVGNEYEVSVDEISPEQVIFTTPDGYKMRLTLSEMVVK